MVENLHLAAPHIYMLIFCTQQNVSCLFVDDSVTMLRGCQDQDSRHEWQKANRRAKAGAPVFRLSKDLRKKVPTSIFPM